MQTKEVIEALTRAAKSIYEANTRTVYHNWKHAKRVRKHALRLYGAQSGNTENDKIIISIAAAWHDAYYVLHAKASSNEEASATLLRGAWATLSEKVSNREERGILDYLVSAAAEHILATSVNMHLISERVHVSSLRSLLDADLRSLAYPYARFVKYQHKIILENGGDISSLESHSRVAEFLSKFLTCRVFIYHTDEARAIWEVQARSNIQTYAKHVDSFRKQLIEHCHK